MWPWPKNFKIPPLYLLFPQNQFSESMAPRLKRERGCGCRNLAKSFIAFFWFYRNFCFPSRFFKQRWSIAFFSCTRVSQVYIYLVLVGHHVQQKPRNRCHSMCSTMGRHNTPLVDQHAQGKNQDFLVGGPAS